MKYLSLLATWFSMMMGQTQAAENIKESMRYSQHSLISKYLGTLSDSDVLALLKQGTPLQSGWGSTLKLDIEGIPIFVKQVPLNEIEGNLKNIKSTENLFEQRANKIRSNQHNAS